MTPPQLALPDESRLVAAGIEMAPLTGEDDITPATRTVSFAPAVGDPSEGGSNRVSTQTFRARNRQVTLERTLSQTNYLEHDQDVKKAFNEGIKEAFNIFADGTGMLTEHAAASLLRFLDKSPPKFMIDNEARAAAGIDLGRTSTKGTIDIEAFTTMLLESIKSTDWTQSAAEVFEQLDTNRNNRVKAKSLRRALQKTFNSINVKKSEAEEMIQLADRSKKGWVDWDDFQALLHAIEDDVQGHVQGLPKTLPESSTESGSVPITDLSGPRIPLPKYLRDARRELQRTEQSRPTLLKYCARIGCTKLARSEDIYRSRRALHDVDEAKDNKFWKIVHIYTRSGLLGRVRGQGEFWHGHEAAKQIVDEDETDSCSEGSRVITPGNSFAVVWDGTMIMLLVFVTITEPFRVGFGIGADPWEPLFVTDVCIDIFFVCDMVLQFFTAYSDTDGTGSLETDLRKTAKKYASTWFIWDLISVFPFTYILQPWTYSNADATVVEDSRLLRFARLPRLIKLLRLARVKRVIERYAEIWVSVRTLLIHYDLIVLILETVLLAHVMACLWFFFGALNSEQQHYDGAETSWLQEAYPDAPILRDDTNRTVDWYIERYTVSIYWAFTTITTVGYGDITATNVLEQILCLICMFIGVVVFTTVAAQLHSQLETKQAGQFEAEKKISKLVSFLKQRQVHAELRNQIRDFYVTKYRYQYTCGFDEEEMLQELPPTLARDLTEHLYAKYWQVESMKFWRILMFSRLDRRDQVALCKAFKSMFVGLNRSVYDQNDFGIGIFVLLRGKVMLSRTYGINIAAGMLADMQVNTRKTYAKLSDPQSNVAFSFTFDKGDCLGEVETIAELETDHSIPRYGDSVVKSRRGAELLALDEASLAHFAEAHPELLKRFEEVARVREEKICQRLVHDLELWTGFLFDVVVSEQTTAAAEGSSEVTDEMVCQLFEKCFEEVATEIYGESLIAEDLLKELRDRQDQRIITRDDIDNWLRKLEDSVREYLQRCKTIVLLVLFFLATMPSLAIAGGAVASVPSVHAAGHSKCISIFAVVCDVLCRMCLLQHATCDYESDTCVTCGTDTRHNGASSETSIGRSLLLVVSQVGFAILRPIPLHLSHRHRTD